jgi:hypothetical protein
MQKDYVPVVAILLFTLVLFFFFISEWWLEKKYHPEESLIVVFFCYFLLESSMIMSKEFFVAIVSVYVEYYIERLFFPKLTHVPSLLILGFVVVCFVHYFFFCCFSWLLEMY